MKKSMKPLTARALFASAAVAVAVFSVTAPAPAHAFSSSGDLYYRMGGESPGGRANYDSQIAQKLGMDGTFRLNYACGKFDLELSFQYLITSLKETATKLKNALYAGISALPLYILMRAQPGLYQLFQTYSAKADTLLAAALKTCEEMEAQIYNKENPYEDWMRLAKAESWKGMANVEITRSDGFSWSCEYGTGCTESKSLLKAGEADVDENGNIVVPTSQQRIENKDILEAKDFQEKGKWAKRGHPWVFGKNAGGVNQDPIRLPQDVVHASYCTTLELAADCDEEASHADIDSRLTAAFPDAKSLISFVTEGISGNTAFYICQPPECPQPTSTVTAVGLKRKAKDEYDVVQPVLQELASSTERGSTAYDKLKDLSAPDFMVNGTLLETLRRLPTEERDMAVERIARELAIQRTINKAQIASDVLLTGLSLPALTSNGNAIRATQEAIDAIDKQIERLRLTAKVQKDSAENVLAIIGHVNAAAAAAAAIPPAMQSDPSPLQSGGFVSTTPAASAPQAAPTP